MGARISFTCLAHCQEVEGLCPVLYLSDIKACATQYCGEREAEQSQINIKSGIRKEFNKNRIRGDVLV
jgi:hypothetical protein